jgi:hypothetical protein
LKMSPTGLFSERYRHESEQRTECDTTKNGATPKTEQHTPMLAETRRAGQNDGE